MTIVIFIVVLVVLIVVHEFGHFIVAKLSGMKVEEFGIGYPPRVMGITYKGTEYTLNWLPFGGFVKILGEDEGLHEDPHAPRNVPSNSFIAKPHILQAATLLAGIVMNLLFAWLILSLILFMGAERALTFEEATHAKNASVAVADVLPGSPAAKAGIVPGDFIVHGERGDIEFNGYNAEKFSNFVADDIGEVPITLVIKHGAERKNVVLTPVKGLASATPDRETLGMAIAIVGTLPVPLWQAPIEGAKLAWTITRETALGLAHLFMGIFTFTADLSQVSGPVGIVGAVGSASSQGLASLLFITAVISINLALINLVPIPALDGGRLLFVILEAIVRRPMPKGVALTVNTVGFGFLILLMLVVTAHDIFKLVH